MTNVTNILIIDDDELVRQMIKDMLDGLGYATFEAADGRDGLLCLEHNPIDLVITDILMPGVEGIETIIELRRRWPEIPIIAISGGDIRGLDHLQAARALGADVILHKPFSRAQIIDALEPFRKN